MVDGLPSNPMDYPSPTGQVAQTLGVIEPRLNELIRKGRLVPAPTVVAGRRQWHRQHVLQAASALGVLTPELRRLLGEEVTSVPV